MTAAMAVSSGEWRCECQQLHKGAGWEVAYNPLVLVLERLCPAAAEAVASASIGMKRVEVPNADKHARLMQLCTSAAAGPSQQSVEALQDAVPSALMQWSKRRGPALGSNRPPAISEPPYSTIYRPATTPCLCASTSPSHSTAAGGCHTRNSDAACTE